MDIFKLYTKLPYGAGEGWLFVTEYPHCKHFVAFDHVDEATVFTREKADVECRQLRTETPGIMVTQHPFFKIKRFLEEFQ